MSERAKKLVDSFRTGLANQSRERAADSHIEAECLLAMCVDCRYSHVFHEHMRKEYTKKLYGQVVLAGASLALGDSYT